MADPIAKSAPARTPALTALKGDAQTLRLTWSDGVTHTLTWQQIRGNCPCAVCRAKKNEPAPMFIILKPQEVEPVRGTGMQALGNYAYHIDFSDGHDSGIYSLEVLRELGETLSG